ncbi:MAG: hypothetical protein Q9157_007469 [Trypethelium eluteriae]
MHRGPDSSGSANSFNAKKFTSKGVYMRGALGVPSHLKQSKPKSEGKDSSAPDDGEQQRGTDNDQPPDPSETNASAVPAKSPKGKPKKPIGITIEEPRVKPSKSWRYSEAFTQMKKHEAGLRKLVAKLARKPSVDGKQSTDMGSKLTKTRSPYPDENVKSGRVPLLAKKLSSKVLRRKSSPDLQLHVHPAERVPPPPSANDGNAASDINNNSSIELIRIRSKDPQGRPYQNDESLRKWKESLGLGTGEDISDSSDPRRVIIKSLGLEVEGRPDIIIDLTGPGAVEALKEKPFTIKEGANFRMKATFKVQHQILSGLKYVQNVKRGVISNKMQEMIGSYSPNTKEKPIYEKKFESETAPSGMIGRGHYNAVSRFIDDDKHVHLQFEWSFDVKKDW